MKRFFPLLAALLVLANLILWCCNPPQPAKQAELVKTVKSEVDTPPQVDSATAMAEKNQWLSKRAALITALSRSNPSDSNYLAKSFRLHKGDLTGMLNALNDGPPNGADSIWATLAIRNNQVTLIFHDRDRKTGKQVYYDFTRPCPPGTCE